MPSIQSLAHRAPPAASRTRIRWQPYAPMPPSASFSIANKSPYLNTPAASVTSSPSHSSCDINRVRQVQPLPTPSSSSSSSSSTSSQSRENTKSKYALGLVDQAVKVLGDIWKPQDIPEVFTTTRSSASASLCSDLTVSVVTASIAGPTRGRNTQLSSPDTPTTSNTSPPTPSAYFPQSTSGQTRIQIDEGPGSRKSLVPTRTFIQEVLKRSKTTGSVLQTALCYLEAIRPQIMEQAHLEKEGQGVRGDPELGERIVQGTAADFIEAGPSMDITFPPTPVDGATSSMESLPTVVDNCIMTEMVDAKDQMLKPAQTSSVHESSPLTPLPPLPSPLLCPRRAFLASLILASKFMQDKCYSNRAWAKLSGLAPREISRCERALGDALGWRLWVGKMPVVDSPTASSTSTRALGRCRSEGSIALAPSACFAANSETPSSVSSSRSIRRAATLPSNAFKASDAGISHYQLALAPNNSRMSQVLKNDVIPSQMTPPTPVLSYSPSSTDSSSGDRTIQMSSFSDDSLGTYNPDMSSLSMEWSDNYSASSLAPTENGCGINAFTMDAAKGFYPALTGQNLVPPRVAVMDATDWGATDGCADYISSIMWTDGHAHALPAGITAS